MPVMKREEELRTEVEQLVASRAQEALEAEREAAQEEHNRLQTSFGQAMTSQRQELPRRGPEQPLLTLAQELTRYSSLFSEHAPMRATVSVARSGRRRRAKALYCLPTCLPTRSSTKSGSVVMVQLGSAPKAACCRHKLKLFPPTTHP